MQALLAIAAAVLFFWAAYDQQSITILLWAEDFTARGVNLSRIESRPTGEGLGKYFFSVDVEGHVGEERVAAALSGLHRLCPELRFLGSYPAAQGAAPFIDTHNSDEAFIDARGWVQSLRDRL